VKPAIQHGARFAEGERLFNRNFQAPIHDSAHDCVDRLTPGSGRKVGVAEVKAGERERLRHQPFPEIGKGPAFGLAEAHDMTKLADRREAAVEDAGAGRVQHLVHALAVSEAGHGLNEIFVFPVDDLGRAVGEGARLLAFGAHGSNDGRASAHRELRCEQAHAAADGVDEDDVAWLGHTDVVQEMPRGEPLDREGGRHVEPHARRDWDQAFDPRDALISEAAGFLKEGRDTVADLRADDAWSERCDPS
jgi:hypothetical protein